MTPRQFAQAILPQLASGARASGGPVAKAGAVLAVSGGLVASLGMQSQSVAMTTVPASSRSATAGASDPTAITASSAGWFTTRGASGLPQALVLPPVVEPAPPHVGQSVVAERTAPKQTAARLATPPARTIRPFTGVSRSSTRVSMTSASGSSASDSTARSVAPVSIRAGAPGSPQFGAAVLAIAARYAGIAYRYGGTTPAGFDCSGFTRYVFAQVGIDLPRTSDGQRAATTRISRSAAVAGDLVFMPGHVGIYAGNGMMWDSPRSGEVIALRPVYSSSATYGRVG